MARIVVLCMALVCLAFPAHAAFFTWVNICAQAYPDESGNPVLNCAGQTGFGDSSSSTDVTLNVDNVNAGRYPDLAATSPGSYSGWGSASMTPDTFRLSGGFDLVDYARGNRVNISDPYVLQGMFLALGTMTDGLTVTGGTGVYSLSYVLSLDGMFTRSNELNYSLFCAFLIMPTGAGSSTSYCASAGDPVAPTVTLTYTDLAFGDVIEPTLQMNVGGSLDSLYPTDVASMGEDLVTGGATADFGSTIHITDLLVTDSNGNPIPGVTVHSDSGYVYPLDPANGGTAVPEPGTIGLMAVALLGLAQMRRRGAVHAQA